MKFLLIAINAKFIHFNLAVRSLRAWCIERQPEMASRIDVAEYTINQPAGEIMADIYRRRPDVAAFSCYIWNWKMVQEILCELGKLLPDMPVWLGGPEVSYDPEEVLWRFPRLTGIMEGEGEETFRELADFYERRAQEGSCPSDGLYGIRGLVYRPAGAEGRAGLRRTPPRPFVEMDDLPFPYTKEELEGPENRILYYESSRGCPYRCTYCLSSIDKTVRLRSPDLVKRDLDFFLEAKVPQVKFVDRTFNCDPAHAMGIWKYILEHDNGITNFHFEISADILTEEETALLGRMRPGLVQMEIGVQSTTPETLREIRRGSDWNRLKRNVEILRQGRNIHLHLDLIAGLPLEGGESFQKSFNDVYSCRPEQLQLGFLKVLKGSYLYERASEYGIAYTEGPPYEALFTKWLPYEEMLLFKRVEEVLELYYNSGQFAHTLPVLEQCFENPFDMYRCLAEYVEEKGYFLKSPSREYRYRLLLDFASQRDPGRRELYGELLTLDLYLRENRKNRPDFAPAPWGEAEKKRIVEFYRRESREPVYLENYVRAGYDSRQMARLTHIEGFTHPVWEPAEAKSDWGNKTGQKAAGGVPRGIFDAGEKERYWLLFDYERRDPLTRAARLVPIRL